MLTQRSTDYSLRATREINYVEAIKASSINTVVAHDDESVYIGGRANDTFFIEITESFDLVEHDIPEDYSILFSD